MMKIKSPADLETLRKELRQKANAGKKARAMGPMVKIKVAMATCSIATGARETLNYITDELNKRNIDAVVTQTGCMGYCYAEPTIEVTLPEREPLVFGYVDVKKADEIIEKYIKGNVLVDGIIPVNYKKIDE
jgi:NADP-reducing hydrogenase subunit HndB